MKLLRRRRKGTDTAYRLLFYLSQRTSERAQEWRTTTIQFLWNLWQLREGNPGISIAVQEVEGIYLYHDSRPIAYFHLRQRHILIMAAPGYFLWPKKNRVFKTPHNGCWPAMWRCDDAVELKNFIKRLTALPKKKPAVTGEGTTRYIPREVREQVIERDRGRCAVPGCGSTANLHFDHIYPFSLGGDGRTEKNIRLLCQRHNLQKGITQRF